MERGAAGWNGSLRGPSARSAVSGHGGPEARRQGAPGGCRGRPTVRYGHGMSRAVRVVWDDRLVSYDFGAGHPLAPVRVELTMALARDLGVLDGVEVAGCVSATDDELALVHDRHYIQAVKEVSRTR